MGTIRRRRVKANSILETIVAMVIVVVVFGIATSLFATVGHTVFSAKRLKAEGLLRAYSLRTNRQEQFLDGDEWLGSFKITRRVKSIGYSGKLWLVHYSVFDSGGTLLTAWSEDVLAD